MAPTPAISFRLSLLHTALVPLVLAAAHVGPALAQAPVRYEAETRLAHEAYYDGRLEEAEERWRRCVEPAPSNVTRAQRSSTAAKLALVLERLGRRDEALEWIRRSVADAHFGQREWVHAQEAFAGLLTDVRFVEIEAAFVLAESAALDRREKRARAQRATVQTKRAEYKNSIIIWQGGHSGPIPDMEFSPDGEHLVSVGGDSSVQLWSTLVDEPPRTIGLHSNIGVRAEYSRDGEHILVVDTKACTATIYDGRSGEHRLDLDSDDEFVRDAHFDAEGRAWTISTRGRLRRWAVRRGRIEVDRPLGFLAQSIDISPNGSMLLILGADGRARLCDTETGEVIDRVGPVGLSLPEVSFNPDGRLVLATADSRVHVVARDGSGSGVSIPRIGILHWPSDDGSRMLTMGAGKSLLLWNTVTGELVATLLPPGSGLRRVASGPGGVVAAVFDNSSVSIWDSATASILGRLDGNTTTSELIFASDGRVAFASWQGIVITDRAGHGRHLASRSARVQAVALGLDGKAATGVGGGYPLVGGFGEPWFPELPLHFASGTRIWDLDTGRTHLAVLGHETTPRYGPGGRTLAIASTNSGCYLRRNDGTKLTLPTRAALFARFSPDGSRIALTVTTGRKRVILMEDEGTSIRPLGALFGLGLVGLQEDICPAQFTPDGALLLACTDTDEVLVADGFDMTEVERLSGHSRPITCIDFDHTGTRLATSSADGTARVWDFDPGFSELQSVLGGHVGNVWCCTFSADGETIATGGGDNTARLWNATTGDERVVLREHTGDIRRVAFHPLTGHLVTASLDGTARIWDGETGEPLHELRGHTGAVRGLDFAEDGRIITWSEDATVRIWSMDGRLLATRVEYDEGGWLTFEPGGRYVAGGQAAEWARVQVNGKAYPLSSYATVLEDPEAVRLSLAGETLPPVPRLSDAPVLRTTTESTGTVVVPAMQIAISIEDSYGLEDLTIERNGVVWKSGIDMDGLRLTRGGRSAVLEVEVPFADGLLESVVRVRATNSRDVKSTPITIMRRYTPPTGDLYLVTIAVADYDDDRLDLASPVRDAQGIAERFRREASGLYRDVHVFDFADGAVTPAALYELQERELSKAGPQDTIVVFVAGHGVRTSSEQYFFLTPAATPASPYSGIHRDQLEALVSWDGIAARRRVLFLDTCNAGQELGDGTRGIGQEEAFTQSQVNDSLGTGLYIVAGSTELGAARETAANGVFTSALLAGLDGAADTAVKGNHNGTVDIGELIAYASKIVSEAEGVQKVTTPKVEGGNSFPLARSVR